VKRGLVTRPDYWQWSSYRHYANGGVGVVEIESQWTARKREWAGVFPKIKVRSLTEDTRPRPALSAVEGVKLERDTFSVEIAVGWAHLTESFMCCARGDSPSQLVRANHNYY